MKLFFVPQTKLELMRFSRFVLVPWISPTLWSRAAAQDVPTISGQGPGPSPAQARLLEMWKSGDLKIQKFGVQQIKDKIKPDQRELTVALHIDLQKAFDLVNRPILIRKLRKYKTPDYLVTPKPQNPSRMKYRLQGSHDHGVSIETSPIFVLI